MPIEPSNPRLQRTALRAAAEPPSRSVAQRTCVPPGGGSSKPTMGKTTTLAVLVTVAFSVVGVLGDYFLKLASVRDQPLRTGSFYLGFALYASTAFGWGFVMST